MKVVYIAGPHKASSEYQVRLNVRNAEIEALWVWYNGGVAICPQKNIAGLGGANDIHDDVWLQGNLELLIRSDALYAIGKYKESNETMAEIQFAVDNHIQVITTRLEIINYLNNYSKSNNSEIFQEEIYFVK